MATYVIGDIQGCYTPLRKLLDKLRFDPRSDRVWLAGDLVNRGPESLQTLRFIKGLGSSAVSVLGNHDLHLIACAHQLEQPRKKDTFDELWAAEDFEELVSWLRRQPLLHYDEQLNTCMVHAGLAPQWNMPQAMALAREVEAVLSSTAYGDYLDNLYGNEPDQWQPSLHGWSRLRFITNCLTRIRYCHPDGRLDMGFKGTPGKQPEGLLPWFDHPQFLAQKALMPRIVFGHWSTLSGIEVQEGCFCLDTGCLWGGDLTALHLETREFTAVSCNASRKPG